MGRAADEQAGLAAEGIDLCVRQLCGERQVKNAWLALAHNVGGPGAVACVIVLGQAS